VQGYWSEASVFIIVGMTTDNDELIRKGFTMVLDGQELAPALVGIIYRKLINHNVIEDPGHRSIEQLKEWMPDWIEELDERLHKERIDVIEDLLANLPTGDLN
tara:strand:+ start:9504 stop:9812 length:309 start_codon:yes stop_codon:yes gene_type:complete